jgi:hypothetical protein
LSEGISQHKVRLAQELLDDVELSRLGVEQLLLKASRLARLVEADEISSWLKFELSGYPGNDPIALKYMGITNRWTDQEKNMGYWKPLSELSGVIVASEAQMRQLQIPNVNLSLSSSNPHEWVCGFQGNNVTNATQAVNKVVSKLQTLANTIAALQGVRSRVLSVLHDFISTTYYQLAFSNLTESIFSSYKQAIDVALIGTASDVVEKIPAVYDRLSSGDPEAISQALTTCRRMIHGFADAFYPPTDKTVKVEGKDVSLGEKNYLNRINALVDEHCTSTSRRQRLRKTIREIHERVSAGVHDDVTLDEAKALFVQVYLILGEIALLVNGKSAHVNPTGIESGAAPEN